jgi:dihydrofolate synthase/folylpolyglutamate synthase
MYADIDSILEKYHQSRQWLMSLITDPTGARYLQEKSDDIRLKEFREQIERTGDFLDFAGNPQKKYHSIHIAGTSGKGSVVNMIAAILFAAGLKTGFHVSPYLQVCNEKLIVEGKMISPSAFVNMVDELRDLYGKWRDSRGRYQSLKYGEAWVALTYLWMAKCQVEWAVIETGLGGRYDPTNVLPSVMQVITNVNYDHVEVLGPELTDIAEHKAGIIKPNGLVVTAVERPDLLSIIHREAKQKGANVYCLGKDFDYTVTAENPAGTQITVQTPRREYKQVKIAMGGNFQPINAALSIASVDILVEKYNLTISEEEIRTALDNLVFPGRMEIVQDEPLVILDGAHNTHKMGALVESLICRYSNRPITAIIGILSTKDFKGMIERLAPIASRWVVTQPHVFGKPSTPPSEIVNSIREINPKADVRSFDQVSDAMHSVLSEAAKDDLIVVTGSLYLVGEARERWFPTREILRSLELGD